MRRQTGCYFPPCSTGPTKQTSLSVVRPNLVFLFVARFLSFSCKSVEDGRRQLVHLQNVNDVVFGWDSPFPFWPTFRSIRVICLWMMLVLGPIGSHHWAQFSFQLIHLLASFVSLFCYLSRFPIFLHPSTHYFSNVSCLMESTKKKQQKGKVRYELDSSSHFIFWYE